MLYNYVLFFLGFYSWDFESSNFIENMLKKTYINDINNNKNSKNKRKFIDIDIEGLGSITNSPGSLFYGINIELSFKKLDNARKIKLYMYNFYSLIIFLFLCIEPLYLFICLCYNKNNFQEYLLSLLNNINTPICYIWGKLYFKTNHFDLVASTCNKKNCGIFVLFIIIATLVSIIINLTRIDTFYNEYYYIIYFDKSIGLPIVILEWIYSRLVYSLLTTTFTIVFCKHISEIKQFIKDVNGNTFELDNTYCLSDIIKLVGIIRHSVENSIQHYNKLISFITVCGGISLAIYIRDVYMRLSKFNHIQMNKHEYYMIQSYILYVICQIIFFYSVISYANLRTELIKVLESSWFINKFLTRLTSHKLKKKCRDECELKYINKVILCIEQDNATSIDWIVLDKLTKNKWMDFSILGISTQDGTLIKKVIAFGSLIYLIISYI